MLLELQGYSLVYILSRGRSTDRRANRQLAIMLADGRVMINDANVTATDIETSNGVIHVIDSVIIPRG